MSSCPRGTHMVSHALVALKGFRVVSHSLLPWRDLHGQSCLVDLEHKVLINIEYRAVSGVFQTIDPLPPPPSVSSPRTKGYTLAGWWGGGVGSICRKTPDIGLASYSIIPLRSRRIQSGSHSCCSRGLKWSVIPSCPGRIQNDQSSLLSEELKWSVIPC